MTPRQIGRNREGIDDERFEDEMGGHERAVPTTVRRSGPGFTEEAKRKVCTMFEFTLFIPTNISTYLSFATT